MSRSNLSLWFGLTNALLIIYMLVHNVEMQMANLHMGILETRQDFPEDVQQVQSGTSTQNEDNEYCKRLQCSYALSALRHLKLIEKSLYSTRTKKLLYTPNYDLILFDDEAASMIATIHSMPLCNPSVDFPWTLWFYTDKVRRLLQVHTIGDTIDSRKTQSMYNVHKSVKKALRIFVQSSMDSFKDVQKKLKEIDKESNSDVQTWAESISRNKKLLKRQMEFNERYGVSADGKKYVSFESITVFNKLDKMKSIVIEYFGEIYWINVQYQLLEMYDTATEVDIMISYQITCLWHVKQGIVKILKLILVKFIDSYLDLTAENENVEEIKTMDKTMTSKLTEFCECIGKSPIGDTYVLKFGDRYFYSDFYNGVKRNIAEERELYPGNTEIENISSYYSVLTDERSATIPEQTKEWTNIGTFIEQVKRLFSDVNLTITGSFDFYVTASESLKKMKEVEHLRSV